MAGYSSTPLVTKIGIKPGTRFVLRGAPAAFREELTPLPADVTFLARTAKPVDGVILFAPDAATLRTEFPVWAARLLPAGMLWVAWPRKAGGMTSDLNENLVRATGLANHLVDVKVCAINEQWSGLKFVRRLEDR